MDTTRTQPIPALSDLTEEEIERILLENEIDETTIVAQFAAESAERERHEAEPGSLDDQPPDRDLDRGGRGDPAPDVEPVNGPVGHVEPGVGRVGSELA